MSTTITAYELTTATPAMGYTDYYHEQIIVYGRGRVTINGRAASRRTAAKRLRFWRLCAATCPDQTLKRFQPVTVGA